MRPLFYTALVLSGCATGYQWYPDNMKTDYYRWEVVEKPMFQNVCGFVPPDRLNGGGGCAIRMMGGVIQAGDKPVTNAQNGYTGPGKLCVIFSTLTEEEADRVRDWDGTDTLRNHEVRHCRGELHSGGPLDGRK